MTYDDKKMVYLAYLRMKIQEEDWHGVADCAMDLRDLDSEKKGRETALNEFERLARKL